jgi:hypothetical protein
VNSAAAEVLHSIIIMITKSTVMVNYKMLIVVWVVMLCCFAGGYQVLEECIASITLKMDHTVS